MYRSFCTTILKPDSNESIEVTKFMEAMAICTPVGPILITKEQAMEFFGLVDPTDYDQLKTAYTNALTAPYGGKPKPII
jgi:hypothetical protein